MSLPPKDVAIVRISGQPGVASIILGWTESGADDRIPMVRRLRECERREDPEDALVAPLTTKPAATSGSSSRWAHLLLSDCRVGLDWERYGSGKVGLDFTLTMPGLPPVNLELTRVRRDPGHFEAGSRGSPSSASSRRLEFACVRIPYHHLWAAAGS